MTVKELVKKIKASKVRSTWARGVRDYALELLEVSELPDKVPEDRHILRDYLLNGADTWKAYSWGGCSLIYDRDICERLATPSEKKITKNGARKPNSREEWLDTQARALYQAEILIYQTLRA